MFQGNVPKYLLETSSQEIHDDSLVAGFQIKLNFSCVGAWNFCLRTVSPFPFGCLTQNL